MNNTDDDLIANLRQQPGKAKPVELVPSGDESPKIAAKGNQVDLLVREIWRTANNGQIGLLPDEYQQVNVLRLNGVRTLAEAQWVRKIHAQYGVFKHIWRRKV